MRVFTKLLLFALAASLIGCVSISLPKKTREQYSCQILDQFGNPVPAAKVLVVTAHGQDDPWLHLDKRSIVSQKIITTQSDGSFTMEWAFINQSSDVTISISKPGFYTNSYFYTSPQNLGSDVPKRLMLQKITDEKNPVARISNGYDGIERRTRWLGKPLYFDLEKCSFVESGGDLEISVQRPDFGDTNKMNHPFSAGIKAIEGTLHPCSDSEYTRSFIYCVPSWGTNQPIVFNSPNCRRSPSVWTHFIFHTRGGKNNGKAVLGIDVIGERKYNDPELQADTEAWIHIKIEAYLNTQGSLILGPRLKS